MKRLYVLLWKFFDIFVVGFIGGLCMSIYKGINRLAVKFYEGKMTK